MAEILLVDDDSDFVEATKMVLESRGHNVTTASSGSECLTKAKAEKPDVIVLDVMMAHDSEGFDVARQIQQTPETRGIAVIILTGILQAKNLPFSYEPDEDWLPVKAVLEKPVSPEVLLRSVEDALKR